MHTIFVGKLLKEGVTQYEEMPEYNFRSGVHRLIIAMKNLTPKEIDAVRHVDVKLAFTVIGEVIIFQYRFGAVLPWSDAAYTWHKVPISEQVRPRQLTGEQRVLLEIILVEATTGIVQAIRVVSLSPTFSQRLHTAINRQADNPMPDDYDAQTRRIFDNFTSGQLRARALGSCTGGDTVDRPSPY